MPIIVKWDNEEKTIIRYFYEGNWTWDDAHQAMLDAVEMTKSVPHVVDAIIDISAIKGLPLGAITQFRTSRKLKPANRGLLIIISSNLIFNTLPKVAQSLFPQSAADYRLAKNEDEAITILKAVQSERAMQTE